MHPSRRVAPPYKGATSATVRRWLSSPHRVIAETYDVPGLKLVFEPAEIFAWVFGLGVQHSQAVNLSAPFVRINHDYAGRKVHAVRW